MSNDRVSRQARSISRYFNIPLTRARRLVQSAAQYPHAVCEPLPGTHVQWEVGVPAKRARSLGHLIVDLPVSLDVVSRTVTEAVVRIRVTDDCGMDGAFETKPQTLEGLLEFIQTHEELERRIAGELEGLGLTLTRGLERQFS